MNLGRPAFLIASILTLPACTTAVPQDEPQDKMRRDLQEQMRKMEERHQAERRELEQKFHEQMERSKPGPEHHPDGPPPGPEQFGRAMERLQSELRDLRRDVERLHHQLQERHDAMPPRQDLGKLLEHLKSKAKDFAPLLKIWMQQHQGHDRPREAPKAPGQEFKNRRFEFHREFQGPGELRKFLEQFKNFQKQPRHRGGDDDEDEDGDDDDDGPQRFEGPGRNFQDLEKLFKQFHAPGGERPRDGKKEKSY